MLPQYLAYLIPGEPYYRSPEKEKSTEMKKVALLTISATHASVENYRPASRMPPSISRMGLRKEVFPHSRSAFRYPIRVYIYTSQDSTYVIEVLRKTLKRK